MREPPSSDAGFATATAMMFCAGLAVVAAALLDLGFASRQRAQAHVTQEGERQALASALADQAAKLANGDAQGLGASKITLGAFVVEVDTANELAKTNIYLARPGEIEAIFGKLGISATDAAIARHASLGREGQAGPPLEVVLDELHLDEQQKLCARQLLTVHASAVDPFAGAGSPATARGGAILSIRARIAASRPLDLTREQIVLVTGRLDEPLQVLEDHVYRTSDRGRCK